MRPSTQLSRSLKRLSVHNLSPSAANEPVSVRTLTTPTRSEIEALAELFDKYRAHYGEASYSSQAIGWLEQNLSSHLRAFVAEDSGRFVGFAITMEVPASLRLAHFWQIRDLFVLPTHRRRGVGSALLSFVRSGCNSVGRTPPSACRPRKTTTPLSVSTPSAATP